MTKKSDTPSAGDVPCPAKQPDTNARCTKSEHPPDEPHAWEVGKSSGRSSPPRVAAGASATSTSAPASSARPPQRPGAPPVLPASRMVLPSAQPQQPQVKPGYKLLVAGMPGAGKTTLGIDSDNPIFIPAELSSNVPRELQFPRPRTWEEIGDACRVLLRGGHGKKTLVLDTLDAANRLCVEHVKARKGIQYLSEGSGDYAKGREAVFEEWSKLTELLDRLRAGGMNIMLLAHVKIGRQRNPEGADYDAWRLVLDDKVADFLIGWIEIASFATLEVKTVKEGKGKAKGAGTGARWWYFQPTATALFCKNRHNLPLRLPLRYDDFAAELVSKSPENVAELIAEVRAQAARLEGHTFRDRSGATHTFGDWVEEELKRSPQVARLLQISSRLAAEIERVDPGADEAADKPAEQAS